MNIDRRVKVFRIKFMIQIELNHEISAAAMKRNSKLQFEMFPISVICSKTIGRYRAFIRLTQHRMSNNAKFQNVFQVRRYIFIFFILIA